MWSGSGKGNQFVVKIVPHRDNRIAARNPYNEDVKAACRSVIGSQWDSDARCWTFPTSRLDDLKLHLQLIRGLNIKVEVAPSLVSWSEAYTGPHAATGEAERRGAPSIDARTVTPAMDERFGHAGEAAERRDAAPPVATRLFPSMEERIACHMDPRNRVDLRGLDQAMDQRNLSDVRGLQHNSPISPAGSPMKGREQNSQARGSQDSGGVITVRIHKHRDGRIAARSPYKEQIKDACKGVSGSMWDVTDRCWTFPGGGIDEVAYVLLSIPDFDVKLEAVPPLVLPEAALRQQRAGPGPSHPLSPVRSRAPEAQAPPLSPGLPLRPAMAPDMPSATPSPPSLPQQQAVPPAPPPVYLPKVYVKFLPLSQGKFAIRFAYCAQLVSIMRSFVGAEWRASERLWVFPLECLTEMQTRLQAVEEVEVVMETFEPLVQRALEDIATASDDSEKYKNIPARLEEQLMDFQREGVRFALKRGGRALIADEMGLGKTVQAISICAAYRDEWPVLVLVPSSLLVDWAMAIRRWLNIEPSDITVVLAQSGGRNREGFNFVQSTGKRPLTERLAQGLFTIVSYSLLDKLMEKGQLTQEFRMAIVDESHYLKNPTAKRTAAAKSVLQSVDRLILLTGTPALSRPIELFNQLHVLQPKVYTKVKEYGSRYCEGGRFGMYQGASNKEELHGLVKSTVMIRRLKKDVLKQLPQKRRQQVFLTIDDKGLRQLKALFDQRSMINAAIDLAQTEEEKSALRYKEQQLTTKLYIDSATVKITAVQEYVSNLLDNNIKFLIFAHHETLMNGIEAEIKKSKVKFIRIDGKTQTLQRQSLVQRFQENEDERVALLSIRAAGVGLTLTAASTVVFAEMAWTPMDLVQAEDRAHRIGQESSVNVIYLHAKETIDDVIWDVIGHKLENLGQVLDGKEDRLQVASTSKLPFRGTTRQTTLSGFLSQSSTPPVQLPASSPPPVQLPASTAPLVEGPSQTPPCSADDSSEVDDVVSLTEE